MTFLVFLFIIFILPRAIPGNPLASLLYQIIQQAQSNPDLVKTVHKKLLEEFGMDKPIYIQLFEFLGRLFGGISELPYPFIQEKLLT
ncbi:MAG: hypothetical protein N3E47_03320 [Candidatus Bathyarchaeota archaeon]|nr:hypothetical protein [Candidatus Bathyarchaeota archaeon]